MHLPLIINIKFVLSPNIYLNILQGNGYEHDFYDNDNVYIMDVYNRQIYPFDRKAKSAINRRVELLNYTNDEEYLCKMEL